MKRMMIPAACFCAVMVQGFPLWFDLHEKDGSFRIEQLDGALLHFDRKWHGRGQTPKSVKGAFERTEGTYRLSGEWLIGRQSFRLDETVRELSGGGLEYAAALKSDEPVETAEVALNIRLPLAVLAGKSITVDGEVIRYAEEPSKKNNRFFKAVKQVAVEMPEGTLVISGAPFRALLQDNRTFAPKGGKSAPGSYSLRLYPQEGGEGACTGASFRYRFAFRGIASEVLDLSPAANRDFRDDAAGDGRGGWNDQGPENDLRMFRPGRHRFFGVEFQVVDPAENGGRACIVLNGANRDCFLDAASVKSAQKGKFLYLLHANAFTGKYKDAGFIDVKFADGSAQEITVRNRVDVGNWWGGVDHGNAPVVWKGTNAKSVVGLYMTGFELRRGDPIEITFRKGEYPVWMIVAATLIDRKAESYKVNSDIYILPGKAWAPTQVREIVPGTVLDLSPRVEAPAGRDGRIVISKEGKFVFENAPGKRIRFLGVNICAGANYLSKKDAEEFAGRMARAGYNSVRIHHFEEGLNNGKGGSSCDFDPEQMDKLDYLVHCLKRRGIYVTFDLYASRRPRPGELPPFGDFKVGVCFNDAYMRNWKEFATRLLTHVNPYTQLRWADDPVFFCLNLVNENPLVKTWRGGDEKAILAEYGVFLERNGLRSEQNLARRDGPFLRFLAEKQNAAIRTMTEHIRDTIGSRILITDINCDEKPYLAHSRKTLELVDSHYYHDHPSHPQGGWNPPSVFTQFSSISRYAETPRMLMPTRIFGRPFIVTEYQFCHPNRYIAEAGPLMGAYPALQDWDGLWRFQYALSDGFLRKPGWVSYFSMSSSPTMRMSEYITYFLFVRGDVRPAPEGTALPIDDSLYELSSLPPEYSKLGLEHRIGFLPEGAEAENVKLLPKRIPVRSGAKIVSSTGEISLDPAPEFKVVTPKSECISTAKASSSAGRLSFRNGNTFQTFSLHSLDDLPIADSSSLLFLHLTDVKNSSEKFSGPDMTFLLQYGRTPVLQEVGHADVSLRLPPGNWRVDALNSDGTVKKRLDAVWRDGALHFRPDTREAPACHITRE